ncbi:hypothetical protein [[Muricauda] lutisoli]|uniref:Uncharacterized protein n=1 Tax=[Muricauda] lutisoli TaxID=2816035 RepID=A0ABS3EXZ5_9FLAO|nr:hypothetical protein [[Muricauda] lutisoli]MBO0331131.1 hypothetical protein [[Muricauda] lutisoli]
MFTSEDFYNSYQLNFFDYKQNANKYLLGLDDDSIEKLMNGIYHSEVNEFKSTVKMDIRLTCLWSIDTLFELLFALLPDHKQRLQGSHIVDNLSKGKFYYKDLEKWINGSKGNFERLNWTIHHKSKEGEIKRHCSTLRYLFYKGIFDLPEEKDIQESVMVLDFILKYLGREITDNRGQLNSFKHGVRLLPFLKSMHLSIPGDKSKEISFDLQGSISYQTVDKHKNMRTINTDTLNPERDFELTTLCTNMIYNIIIQRKTRRERFKVNGSNFIFLFTEILIEELKKIHPKVSSLKINLRSN